MELPTFGDIVGFLGVVSLPLLCCFVPFVGLATAAVLGSKLRAGFVEQFRVLERPEVRSDRTFLFRLRVLSVIGLLLFAATAGAAYFLIVHRTQTALIVFAVLALGMLLFPIALRALLKSKA